MAIRARCPQCGRSFSMQDGYLGKQFKCPNCKTKFVVGQQQDVTEYTSLKKPEEIVLLEEDADEYRRCPYCGELIRGGAVKCKHCREYLSEELRRRSFHPPSVTQKQKKIPLSWWLLALIPIWLIGLIFGILAVTQKRRHAVLFLVLAITVLPFLGYIPIGLLAISSLEKSRIAAYEAATIQLLKTLSLTLETFRARRGDYPQNLTQLEKDDYLDLGGRKVNDNSYRTRSYIITYYPKCEKSDKKVTTYIIVAEPELHGRIFSITPSGVIRAKEAPFGRPSDYETAKELYENSFPPW